MAALYYMCDYCSTMIALAKGELHSLPFNKMPTLVLEADRHRCPKRGK